MSIAAALREIGRGREGARSLGQEQAAEVFGRILRGQVSDLELGAFCIAMRVKSESTAEMLGFLQAVAAVQRESGTRLDAGGAMPIVLPSYNGSRRLPLLTPLLALALAQQGVPVLLHGHPTEDSRVPAFEVLRLLGHPPAAKAVAPRPGQLVVLPLPTLSPGLARLLEARRVIGLRNSGHSLVKLMNPFEGRALVVGSYTHPEYAHSMGEVFEQGRADAVLLRGTEGEPVADPRRRPALDGFDRGRRERLQAAEEGSLRSLPELPAPQAEATAAWTEAVLAGRQPWPVVVQQQVVCLAAWRAQLLASAGSAAVALPTVTSVS